MTSRAVDCKRWFGGVRGPTDRRPTLGEMARDSKRRGFECLSMGEIQRKAPSSYPLKSACHLFLLGLRGGTLVEDLLNASLTASE